MFFSACKFKSFTRHLVFGAFVLLFLFYGLSSQAHLDHVVKLVYFVPNDRAFDDVMPKKFSDWTDQVHSLYLDQMQLNGYGNKSFNLERDQVGNIVVHRIKGKFNDADYRIGTLNKVDQELRSKFNDVGRNIYIISVDLSSELVDGNCGIARYEGGPIVIPSKGRCVSDDKTAVSLIAHELGHALNLHHDFRSNRYYMSWGSNRDRFSNCAMDYLSVSPFFNSSHRHTNVDGNIEMLTSNIYPLNHDNWKLKFRVSDLDKIHQVQLEYSTKNNSAGLSQCICIPNKLETVVSFDMPIVARSEFTTNIWVHLIDKNSNKTSKEFKMTGIEASHPWTYLTLEGDIPNSINPVNPPNQWGWNWRGNHHYWEKIPGEEIPDKPHNGFVSARNIKFINEWDHWFYLHASGKIMYDLTLSDPNHRIFDCYFYLPNPCNNIASVEILIYADEKLIYNSGVMRWADAQNKQIKFNLPNDTNKLTIESRDGGDDIGCDHFIIADAKLLSIESNELDINQQDKESAMDPEKPNHVSPKSNLVLTWGGIKNDTK